MHCSYRNHCARSRRPAAGNFGTHPCRFSVLPRSLGRAKHPARRSRWERGWARREEKAPTCTSPLSAWPPGARALLPQPRTSSRAQRLRSPATVLRCVSASRPDDWLVSGCQIARIRFSPTLGYTSIILLSNRQNVPQVGVTNVRHLSRQLFCEINNRELRDAIQ